MAITGTSTSGNDTLSSDNAADQIVGNQGDDSISGGGGNDTLYGDQLLVSNGGLDSTQAANSWSLGTVTGWTNSGSGGVIERWGNGFFGLTTADGSPFIELDANSGGAVDHIQTAMQLETGVQYTLTFSAADRPGSTTDIFDVTHNGVVIATISPASSTSFTTYSVTVTGVAGTDTIGFREYSAQNNSTGILLDDVRIDLTQASVDAGTFSYDDVLDGGLGDDRIFGQEGDDTIIGGAGNDSLDGGIGNDIFRLADGSGSDVIADLTIGADKLDVTNLTDSLGNPVDFNDVVVTSDGQGGSILTFPNGETVQLKNIPPSSLDSQQELTDIGIPCFAAGTVIGTVAGDCRVEDLRAGTEVQVLQRGGAGLSTSKALRVFRRKITAERLRQDPKLRPVRICAGALGMGLPVKDLLVSRQHRMLVQSDFVSTRCNEPQLLVAAIKLVGIAGIFIDESIEEVEYFHVLLERHEVVFAEGAPTESLYLGPMALETIDPEALAEILLIFPELKRPGFVPAPARPFAAKGSDKKLVLWHIETSRPLLGPYWVPMPESLGFSTLRHQPPYVG